MTSRAVFDTDWPDPPKPPRRKWWQILGDILACVFGRGESGTGDGHGDIH